MATAKYCVHTETIWSCLNFEVIMALSTDGVSHHELRKELKICEQVNIHVIKKAIKGKSHPSKLTSF